MTKPPSEPHATMPGRGARQPLHVALSGGGTRAALVSGGVLLALHEERDRIEVVSIDAVSGSSLLLSRLLPDGPGAGTAVGDELGSDGGRSDGEAGRDRLLSELDSIRRSGFGNPLRPARLFIALIIAIIGAYTIEAITGPVDPFTSGSNLRRPSAINRSLWFIVPLWLLGLWAMTRADPVRFGRRRDRDGARSFFSRREDPPPSRTDVEQEGVLPSPDVWFGGAQVESNEMGWFSPYDQHPTTWIGEAAGPMQMALMSAAFPGLTPAVEIDGKRYIDGGALDFLALERLTANATTETGRVLSVDASVDLPPSDPPSLFQPRRSDILWLAVQLAVVIGALRIGLAVGIDRTTVQLLGVLAITLLGLRMIMQVAIALVVGLGHELAVELRAIPMLQRTQRELRSERAAAAGLAIHTISLRNNPAFTPCPDPAHRVDLGTKLGPMKGTAAVDLLRFGYLEAKRLVGAEERQATTDWLDEREREARPSAMAELMRGVLRRFAAGVRRLFLRPRRSTCSCR